MTKNAYASRDLAADAGRAVKRVDPEHSRIVARNGEVWDRTANGQIVVFQVEDWMIEVTDPGKCPSMPTSTNGVPVKFRIADE